MVPVAAQDGEWQRSVGCARSGPGRVLHLVGRFFCARCRWLACKRGRAARNGKGSLVWAMSCEEGRRQMMAGVSPRT